MRHRLAFSLVEMLVVIAIVSVLAAMLLPTLERSLEMGRRVSCLGTERNLLFATSAFAEEHNDRVPHQVKNWSAGNRTEDEDIAYVYASAEYAWYSGTTLYGFGLLAMQGYVTDPTSFFCPSLDRASFTGNKLLMYWDQPENAAFWRELIDGDNDAGMFWISAGYANMTLGMNYNVTDPSFQVKAIKNMTLKYIMNHWRDSFSSDPVVKKFHVSPMLYSCFNTDSWYGRPGPFVSHGFEGVNGIYFDGSARWTRWEETGGPLYSGTYYLPTGSFIGWARTSASPGGR